MFKAYLFLFAILIIPGIQVLSQDTTTRPNIILVFADDLGYGDLSCYGSPVNQTPHLDRLASEGIKLTSFYAAASVCTPSRAALLTGRYPLRAGQPHNLGPDSPAGLPLSEETLASALKEQGYRTAAFGKWHLGAVEGYFPTDRGFDEYFGILYSNDMMPPWVNTERPLHLYRNKRPTEEYPVDQRTLTQRYTDEAIRFIRESKDTPFFVYLPYAMPHLPIYASEGFAGRSAGGDYGDVIEEIDHNIGRLLAELEKLGKAENTLVIVTSDNGPWRNMPPRMYETEVVQPWHGGSTGPLRGAKATSYEGGFRVPCIIRWPGVIPPGQLSSELVTTLDLHATIRSLTGAIEPPNPLDGKPVLPVLTQGAPAPDGYFYYFSGNTLDGVRQGKWKLRIAYDASNWVSPELRTGEEPIETQLFDLQNDPYEHFNLAEEYPEVVDELKKILQAYAEGTGATVNF